MRSVIWKDKKVRKGHIGQKRTTQASGVAALTFSSQCLRLEDEEQAYYSEQLWQGWNDVDWAGW